MYYLLMPDLAARQRFIATLREHGVGAVFHYVPLHSSPAGQRFGRAHGPLDVTDATGERLVRLPLWLGLEPQLDAVLAACDAALA